MEQVTSLLDIRKDFPIFKQKVNGKLLIYLDSAATAQKPISVIKALNAFYEEYNSNVFRAIHTLGEKATEKYEESRRKIADFINASHREIVFVRNATEGINLVARSWGKANVKKGDTILLTEMEHHSNLVPWQMLAKEQEAKIEYIPITNEGLLDFRKADELIRKKPKILAITHISNVLGTINPVKELIDIAHENDVKVLIDGAQSVPHMQVDVKDLDCDFLVFSGHKMFGPTGIGILYGKRELLEAMEPVYGGGEMIKEVYYDHATWNDVPHKFEAGTPHIAGAIGLGAAIDYINKIGIKNIFEHNQRLTTYALQRLSKVKGIKIYGPMNPKFRNGVIAFNFGDIHSHDLSTVLDEEGIAVRSGHACAMPLHEKLGIDSSARVSFHIYNSFFDVDSLILALDKARRIFKI